MDKRIFVSVDLPERTKQYLQNLYNPGIYWIKWMKRENLHITLNFLGDLNQGEIEETKSLLAETALNHKPFKLRFVRIRPELDMLWLEPEDSDELYALRDDLKRNLRGHRLGKRERRQYSPHVLVARSKTGRRMQDVIKNFEPQQFLVDKINLYESQLTPGAATHILIESFSLAPALSPPHEGEIKWGS